MPITLVPPRDQIPVNRDEPIKRGRGRPPGSKNKPRNTPPQVTESNEEPTLPAEEALLAEEALPAEESVPVEESLPVEEASEPPIEDTPSDPGDPPPPPKPRERKPRNPPVPPPKPRERKPRKVTPVPEERPEAPESPRTAKHRLWSEYRAAQTSAHAQRRDHFSGLLGRFMR